MGDTEIKDEHKNIEKGKYEYLRVLIFSILLSFPVLAVYVFILYSRESTNENGAGGALIAIILLLLNFISLGITILRIFINKKQYRLTVFLPIITLLLVIGMIFLSGLSGIEEEYSFLKVKPKLEKIAKKMIEKSEKNLEDGTIYHFTDAKTYFSKDGKVHIVQYENNIGICFGGYLSNCYMYAKNDVDMSEYYGRCYNGIYIKGKVSGTKHWYRIYID